MRRWIVGLCVTACAFWSGLARAEEPHAAGEKSEPVLFKAHLHGESEPRLFDLSNSDQRKELIGKLDHVEEMEKVDKPDLFALKRWDLGLWSLLIFMLLFLGLSKFAWKPMIQGLNKREQNIRGALEQAEQTRRQAMELQSQLDAKMRDAGAEIARMMDEARRDATAVKDQMVAEARAQIQQDRDRQLREIDAAKSKAMQEIWQQSVALATSISAKVIRRKLSEEDHRRLLDESLAELKQGAATVRHA